MALKGFFGSLWFSVLCVLVIVFVFFLFWGIVVKKKKDGTIAESRRVEFRIVTNGDELLEDFVNKLDESETNGGNSSQQKSKQQ